MDAVCKQKEVAADIGMGATRSPTLDGHDGIALLDNAQFQGTGQTEFDPVVHVCLPASSIGGSWAVEEEGIATSVQVDLTCRLGIPSQRQDWTRRAVLGNQSGGAPPENYNKLAAGACSGGTDLIGLDTHEVDITMMAPAFCSRAAATAAMATVSVVDVGLG